MSACNPDGETLRERTGRDEMECHETFGYALAMRVLQSDLYAQLDDKQKAECDELIERGMSGAPDCGACPGDSSICQTACRLAEESPPIAPSGAQDDARDAARWRALVNSARIRPLGSAGIVRPEERNYAHLGLELWTVFGSSLRTDAQRERLAAENGVGREWLTTYAEIAAAAQGAAVPPLQISPSSDTGAVTPEEVSALREQNAWLVELYDAVKNLIKVKGRHHTELAYQRMVSAFEKAQRG